MIEDQPLRKIPYDPVPSSNHDERQDMAVKANLEGPHKLFTALSHELRAEILTLLTERGEPMSPIGMHRELGAPVGDISYHVKQLVKYGCAEEVGTRPRRGATEHFYRAITCPNISIEEWEQMPLPARSGFSNHIMQKHLADAIAASAAGTMDARIDRFMARIPMALDEEGWKEVFKAFKRTLDETLEIKARSEERCNESGEEPIRTSASLMCFEMPPKR